MLNQHGLLECLPLSGTYMTTEKGLKVLKLYELLQQDLTPTTSKNNSTIYESLNKKSVWQITASAPIIVTAILSSLFSLATAFA
jgi:hypothetical protein